MRLALIAGVGAAAIVNELHLHPHLHGSPAEGTKKQRKHRDKKKRMAKASRKKNRRG